MSDATPPASELERIEAYLAGRHALCPLCGYDLCDHEATIRCPECGWRISIPPSEESEQLVRARMAAYLREHDLKCRGCKRNLRGIESNTCPDCGATYQLVSTAFVAEDVKAASIGAELTGGRYALVVAAGLVLVVSGLAWVLVKIVLALS